MGTTSKTYLDYLDKEMTIMGILSAVGIATPAGILNGILGDKNNFHDQLWGAGPYFVIVGSVLCILAAAFFYKQRSLLAWYYGQMTLLESLDEVTDIPARLRAYMHDVDAWDSWIAYSWGFDALVGGFLEYAFAVLVVLAGPHTKTAWAATLGGRLCPVFVLFAALLQRHVWRKYRLSDTPWQDFWHDLLRGKTSVLPHHKVYTRLMASPRAGVGVFAIKMIPKGTYVFEPDDDDLVLVDMSETIVLPSSIRRLYEDFCVLKNGVYQCPTTFNKLTPSWYLNHSDTPNVRADESLKFLALRDIEEGEELTANYSSYSENLSLGLTDTES
jgi:SET domain